MRTLTARIPEMHSPINRSAASVIRSGVHYEEKFEPKGEVVSDLPLPTRPYPSTCNPADNLAGMKIGRFTVIGLATTTASWVVRCACGRYCYRKAKVLKTIELQGHQTVMCERCAIIEKSKGKEKYDPHKQALHSAAFPMYQALREILRIGLNSNTRNTALAALALVENSDSARKAWLEDIAEKQKHEAIGLPVTKEIQCDGKIETER
jgi:hypothetical protein